MAPMPERIVLASASTARAAVLRAAGIDFSIEPAAIDEGPLKRRMHAAGEPAIACALALAVEKARHVSVRHSDALVIGADQILALGSDWFDKPVDLQQARTQLGNLRGCTHTLATAVCVVRCGEALWQGTSVPELTMRRFSDSFLDDYLAAEGESLLGSVGAYRLEARGVQLFSRIAGDHFAILGLPLIELLEFLRKRGAVPR
jgi:septum formation protein